MKAHRAILAAVVVAAAGTPAFAAEPPDFDTTVQPFVKTYCLTCHDKQAKGTFRLDTISRDFADPQIAQRWAEVLFRMNVGEMPPKKSPQPKAEELGKVVEWISGRIKEGEAVRMAKRGPVSHYRLSRDEYANTVYDLFGIHYDVYLPGTLIEDPRWHGFDRVGSLLTLSPSHVDRYMKAAETVLDRAFPETPPQPIKKTADAIDIRHQARREWLQKKGVADKVRVPVWPAAGVPGFRAWWGNFKESGVYRCRIKLSGMPGLDGRAPHLSVWHTGLKKSIFDEDVLAPEDKPTVLEFETFLSLPADLDIRNEVPPAFGDVGNHTFNVISFGDTIFTGSKDPRFLNPTGYKLFTDDGKAIYPTLLIDSVEWEGPLTTEAERKKREGLVAKDNSEVRECLKRLATRAWRRPATDIEVIRYVKVVEAELAAGEKFPAAYRAAMVAVLASKNFYYLEEGTPAEKRTQVNDHELASRLSYFLWSSMPDDSLFAAAGTGKLSTAAGLREQLARMLADPKAQRFTDSFPRQWLQLHRVGMFPPDPNLYPDYDRWLEKSMVLETTRYFDTVFKENLSLREFLVSDWTVVNPRLARHYGLPTPTQSGFQKVKLRPEDHRGGLLTQAATLSLTSDGSRHRPVHRGVWVSEAIFGRTPPPPPPNVEPLIPTPTNKAKATVRNQLEAHATHAVCASCHRKIDPLGFALENYDAIGRWRTEEKVTTGQGANPVVNATGTLADVRPFANADEFKKLLADDLDRVAEAFIEQLATYALRRVMTVDDAAAIRAIAAASKKDGYRLRSVVESFVLSDLFRKR